MNANLFSELLTDISDEYIVSAANPHSKPIRWYRISAAAACIVLLISAAIYPKLRLQTPEITEPPESVAEIITTTTSVPKLAEHSETQTATTPIQTTFDSVTAAVNTTASGVNSATVTETKKPTPTESPETAAHTETEPDKVDQPISAEAPQTTAPVITDPTQPVTTEPQPVTYEFPLWKGSVQHPESVPEEPTPMISVRFRIFPDDVDDFLTGTNSDNDYLLKAYGIPAEYDLTQHQCLLIDLDAYMYQDATVIDGEYMNNGLHLKIACLPDTHHDNSVIHFALPIPDDLILEPENCTADYLILTDETEYQALVTDSLTIELHEQEGLQ